MAAALYVSRTAISKWESGRGYPNIDSLKAIATYFSVSVDELLSADQLLTVAAEESKQKTANLRDMVFGLLDVSVALLLFLPWFGQTVDGVLQEVSLLSLTEVAPYVQIAYLTLVVLSMLVGVLALALQSVDAHLWQKSKTILSLAVGGLGALAFMLGLQPYGAAYLFALLIIKVVLLLKKN